MKAKIQISGLVALAVMGGAVASDALAAASVRTLGGTGTYSSAASATSAGTSSAATTGSARAGSMRVTGNVGKSATAATVATPSASGSVAGRTASAPRLSIGKVLTGSTAISRPVNSGSSNSGSGTTNVAGSVDLSEVHAEIKDLRDELKTLDNQYNSLDSQIAGLKEQVDTWEGTDTTEIEQNIEGLDTRLTSVETIVSSLGADADAIKLNLYNSIVNSDDFESAVVNIVKNNSSIEGLGAPSNVTKNYALGYVDGKAEWLELVGREDVGRED